jgi:hypothetical protein
MGKVDNWIPRNYSYWVASEMPIYLDVLSYIPKSWASASIRVHTYNIWACVGVASKMSLI